MRLLAISDLHLAYQHNMEAIQRLQTNREDSLILGGDMCETPEVLAQCLGILKKKFQKLFWVPGNHELWTTQDESDAPRGEKKYQEMIAVCREFDVSTPEDPISTWICGEREFGIVPLFLLYDYSFRPPEVPENGALAWAKEKGLVCADESLLYPDPYSSKTEWCNARCQSAHAMLKALPTNMPLILINHFPLRREQVRLPLIPRFSIWCGTEKTRNWHREFNVAVVVYGHLHLRSTDFVDGVRFEEVSLGYPRQWQAKDGIEPYFREILPGPNRGAQ